MPPIDAFWGAWKGDRVTDTPETSGAGKLFCGRFREAFRKDHFNIPAEVVLYLIRDEFRHATGRTAPRRSPRKSPAAGCPGPWTASPGAAREPSAAAYSAPSMARLILPLMSSRRKAVPNHLL